MRKIYEENTANYPRLGTDVCFVDYENTYRYTSKLHEVFDFVMERQLMDPESQAGLLQALPNRPRCRRRCSHRQDRCREE